MRTFHNPLPVIAASALVTTVRATSAVGMRIDEWREPKLRTIDVRDPILLCGSPRSGTTFLHRFLSESRMAHACTPYDFVFPARSVQALLAPLKPSLVARFPTEKASTPAHKIGLNLAEADDASLALRYFDGFFASPLLRGFVTSEPNNVFVGNDDTFERDAAFFERMWRRKRLADPSMRVAAKLFSAAPRLEAFLGRFPKAQILYTVRDPVEMIPSGMSLNVSMLKKQFNFDALPEAERARYHALLYRSFVAQLRAFHEAWTNSAEVKARTFIVPFPRMMTEFETVMREALGFLGIDFEKFAPVIARTAESQRAYRSTHAYNLERFNLSETTIRRDCDFLSTWWNGKGGVG